MDNMDNQMLGMVGDMKGELGELRGQLRELTTGMNSLIIKVDTLSQVTAQNHSVPTDVAKLEGRVLALEIIEQQRAGMVNLSTGILKSPLLGWAVAGLITLGGWVLVFTGKV